MLLVLVKTIIGVIGKSNIKAKIFSKNTITIDMFGYAYFRNYQYKMVTHARVFSIKYKDKDLTEEEGLYLVSQLKYFRNIYSYNNMASWNKVKDLQIKLPVDNDNKINYGYMNDSIKAIEKKSLAFVDCIN